MLIPMAHICAESSSANITLYPLAPSSASTSFPGRGYGSAHHSSSLSAWACCQPTAHAESQLRLEAPIEWFGSDRPVAGLNFLRCARKAGGTVSSDSRFQAARFQQHGASHLWTQMLQTLVEEAEVYNTIDEEHGSGHRKQAPRISEPPSTRQVSLRGTVKSRR